MRRKRLAWCSIASDLRRTMSRSTTACLPAAFQCFAAHAAMVFAVEVFGEDALEHMGPALAIALEERAAG
jgi:hypothetical protein